MTVDGVPDDVAIGEIGWEQVSGGPGTYTIVHSYDIEQPELVPRSFYVDDLEPDFPLCNGDDKAIGLSGLEVVGPMRNTDPRPSFVERFGGDMFDFTTYRTQYYGGPDEGLAEAEQRNEWVRSPLEASYRAFSR